MADNNVEIVLNKNTGNSDILTRKYFESLAVEMRLVDSDLADISMDFYGNKLDTPVMMGVIGGFSHLGEDANYKATLAAKQLNTVYWTSSHISDEELERMVKTGTKIGIVVKPFKDQEYYLSWLKKAEKAGVCAIATDIDHAYKNGEYDGQQGIMFGPKSVAELREAKQAVGIPFIAKGVLSVQDALKCREAGLDGIILSHHHNIMSYAVPPVMILPEIRKTVGKDFKVFVDCGITGGREAFKALALGADGVLTARGYMAPLAKEGSDGVVNYFHKMSADIKEYMNRTASRDLNNIDPTVIHRVPF